MIVTKLDRLGHNRPQKINLGEMREIGARGLLVYCSDYPRTGLRLIVRCFSVFQDLENLLATASAARSLLSSAIFCASITSPMAR